MMGRSSSSAPQSSRSSMTATRSLTERNWRHRETNLSNNKGDETSFCPIREFVSFVAYRRVVGWEGRVGCSDTGTDSANSRWQTATARVTGSQGMERETYDMI
jgi:hypothetical protein